LISRNLNLPEINLFHFKFRKAKKRKHLRSRLKTFWAFDYFKIPLQLTTPCRVEWGTFSLQNKRNITKILGGDIFIPLGLGVYSASNRNEYQKH
jgi:hypothetical protein